MDFIQHKSFNGTATTTEQTENCYVSNIKLIRNDSDTADLIINISGTTTDGNQIVLKPNESIENWDGVLCNILAYKSSVGNVSFRFIGTKNKR